MVRRSWSANGYRTSAFDKRPFLTDEPVSHRKIPTDGVGRYNRRVGRIRLVRGGVGANFVPTIHLNKNAMKSLATLFVLLFASLSVFAQTSQQPIEVLMVGTAHDYGKEPVEKFDYVKNKVRAFHPDAMFGEW